MPADNNGQKIDFARSNGELIQPRKVHPDLAERIAQQKKFRERQAEAARVANKAAQEKQQAINLFGIKDKAHLAAGLFQLYMKSAAYNSLLNHIHSFYKINDDPKNLDEERGRACLEYFIAILKKEGIFQQKNKYGHEPILGVVAQNKVKEDVAIDLIGVFLRGGSNINAADKDGNTALHHAKKNECEKVFEFLKGADHTIKNSAGHLCDDVGNLQKHTTDPKAYEEIHSTWRNAINKKRQEKEKARKENNTLAEESNPKSTNSYSLAVKGSLESGCYPHI
jgi:hypothetical protein